MKLPSENSTPPASNAQGGLATLLERLDAVRRTGEGRWMARCPAHEDRTPSLSVRELADGLLLVHCFCGCPTESVVGALGMELADLFPDKPIEHRRRERRPFNAADVLECLAFEATVLVVASGDLRAGKPLSDLDHERLVLAAARIEQARGLCNGER